MKNSQSIWAIPIVLLVITILIAVFIPQAFVNVTNVSNKTYSNKTILSLYDIEIGTKIKRYIVKNIEIPYSEKILDVPVSLRSTIFNPESSININLNGTLKLIFETNKAEIEIYKDGNKFWEGHIYNNFSIIIPNVNSSIKISLKPPINPFEKREMAGRVEIYKIYDKCINFEIEGKGSVIGFGNCIIKKDNNIYYTGTCYTTLDPGKYVLCSDNVKRLTISDEMYQKEIKFKIYTPKKIKIIYNISGNTEICLGSFCEILEGLGEKRMKVEEGYKDLIIRAPKGAYIDYLIIKND